MLGAASVLVVHARSWILLAEESTHRTTGEQGAVALNPESGQTATTLESPNKTPPLHCRGNCRKGADHH